MGWQLSCAISHVTTSNTKILLKKTCFIFLICGGMYYCCHFTGYVLYFLVQLILMLNSAIMNSYTGCISKKKKSLKLTRNYRNKHPIEMTKLLK